MPPSKFNGTLSAGLPSPLNNKSVPATVVITPWAFRTPYRTVRGKILNVRLTSELLIINILFRDEIQPALV